ncbi:hypothetical protein GDO78_018027 [Eleutherodactylus coqui]|uniref:Uncharacterized protein n=1 Tax=Eleutherodactylus coqui TaxID=57060 RepID=A0A8J6BQH7_ELECQ|nr:hypothetical protein GDO78_018027 [Eleutherodactylus coqui]
MSGPWRPTIKAGDFARLLSFYFIFIVFVVLGSSYECVLTRRALDRPSGYYTRTTIIFRQPFTLIGSNIWTYMRLVLGDSEI